MLLFAYSLIFCLIADIHLFSLLEHFVFEEYFINTLLLDSGKSIILCLFDLSAAFNTLNDETPTSRLQTKIGVNGSPLQWFASYLANHYQSLCVNSEILDTTLFNYGVPQGLVCGPNKFINYIGPTNECATHHDVSMYQYANETQ